MFELKGLVKFLGLCPFMGVSKKLETAMGM
ncbi:hypothetical protein ELE60_32570, partial [Klebsiella pneumoniae]|nr:hypothetical protein [Klebsiella pneumoniae]